ncbi:MAG: nucleotidyltransferase family protein [Candidatus Omnitrophota bacterium]
MKVLILAAGYATRLYPLTKDQPKPLLKVGRYAILEHIFKKIESVEGVDAAYIITNTKFYSHFREWAEGADFGMPIEAIDDGTTTNDNRLGAIRDIEFVLKAKNIDDDLLVIGGDNIFEFSLKDFAAFAKGKRPASTLALYDLGDIKKASLYGVVKIDGRKEVVGFQEKPPQPESALVATCVYFFPKEKLKLLPEYIALGLKQDAPGNYIKWLAENDKVYGYVFSDAWYDIGDLKSLKDADEKYKAKGQKGD